MKILIFPHSHLMKNLHKVKSCLFLTYDGILYFKNNKRILWKGNSPHKYLSSNLVDELNWWAPIFERWISNTADLGNTRFKIIELINELDEAIDFFKIEKAIHFSACPHHLDQIAPHIIFEKRGLEQVYTYANVIDGSLLSVKYLNRFNETKILSHNQGDIINYEKRIDDFVSNLIIGNKPKTNTQVKSFKVNYNWVRFYLFIRVFKQLIFGKKRDLNIGRKYYFNENEFSYNDNIRLLKKQKAFLKALKDNSLDKLEFLECLKKHELPLVIFSHYQPEATTFPESNRFYDPAEIVLFLRNCGYNKRIFYKEHPASKMYIDPPHIFMTKVGLCRSKQFLKKLDNLNCSIIDFEINSKSDLFKKIIPITISGSIAIERSLIGLKTIVLGEPYFAGLPGTYKFEEFQRLQNENTFDLNYSDLIEKKSKDFLIKLLTKNTFHNYFGIGTGSGNNKLKLEGFINFIKNF